MKTVARTVRDTRDSAATGPAWSWWLILTAAALLAGAGLWAAAASNPPRTIEDQTRQVAETLRCPTCVGENVADSTAPVAEAMRTVIAVQLGEGSNREEIRAWFVDRYGAGILLDPGGDGIGLLLWAVPLVMLGAAVLLLTRSRKPAQRLLAAVAAVAVATAATAPWSPIGDEAATVHAAPAVDAAAILQQAATTRPGDVDLRLALGQALQETGRSAEAAGQYAAAARLRPQDPDIAYRQAAALLEDRKPAGAAAILEENLDRNPNHQPTLLLYGTILRQSGQDRGAELLKRFLQLAPDHPAAAQVQELLGEEK